MIFVEHCCVARTKRGREVDSGKLQAVEARTRERETSETRNPGIPSSVEADSLVPEPAMKDTTSGRFAPMTEKRPMLARTHGVSRGNRDKRGA